MATEHQNDFFAAVAAQTVDYRAEGLVEPEPPVLPETHLPVDAANQPVFSPREKMDGEAALQAELEAYRRRYAPFMQDAAPPASVQTRRSHALSQFRWRIQTAEDAQDFTAVLGGAGSWESVTVPHYGAPLGMETTLYRTTFELAAADLAFDRASVCFKGVDYKAHVFINGNYLGSHEGFFAPFRFDFTACAVEGQNTLVVRVENDYVCMGSISPTGGHGGDKIYAATGPGYDDPETGWHHCPPGMGIYQDVQIELGPATFVEDLFVRPLPEENRAEAWIDVFKYFPGEDQRRFRISVYGANFQETVFEGLVHAPQVIKQCGMNDDFQIALAKANGTYQKPIPLYVEKGTNNFVVDFEMPGFRWWTQDEPFLYLLRVEMLDEAGKVLDVSDCRFGMRSFRMDETSEPKGGLSLNGSPIRLRGSNTMGHEQQSVINKDWDQLRDDILLAKICNMNFLRITQRPIQPEFYDYCDMLGLMVQTDLPTFHVIRRNQYCEVLRQVGEMERLIRSHPSCIMVTYINEPTSDSNNQPHRQVTRAEMESLFRAADDIVHMANPDRVVKACDGDYDPPAPGIQDRHCYPCWYNGQGIDFGRLHKGYWQPTKPDWYHGCGEFGAEGLECAELMRKFYPEEWLPQAPEDEAAWSPNQIVMAQTGKFHYFFFDSQDTLQNWIDASQDHQARSTRLMTEAFRRDNGMNTFAIHLFIDAFPSGWMKTIMDCERHPKKAFFAYRDALAPVLPTLRTDRFRLFSGEPLQLEAWISNDTAQALEGCGIRYQFECDGNVFSTGCATASVPSCASRFQGYIGVPAPEVAQRATVTARLAVVNPSGKVLNDNALEIEIFPKVPTADSVSAVVLGREGGVSSVLAEELSCQGTTAFDECDVILIDDFDAYRSRSEEILAAVENGAQAIFMELEEGRYEIAGSSVKVKKSGFNPLHFASRRTGHPLVEGFAAHDFQYWYDPAKSCIAPLLEATFTAADFTAILTGGNTDENGQWGSALAVAEKKLGAGRLVVCQIKLAGRTATNPPAAIFAQRLFKLVADWS